MAITVNNKRVINQQRADSVEESDRIIRRVETRQYKEMRDAAEQRTNPGAVVVVNGKTKKLNKTSEYLLDMMSQE